MRSFSSNSRQILTECKETLVKMKLPLTFILIVTFCATLAQSQYNLRGGARVRIQWIVLEDVQVPQRVQVTITAANIGYRRASFPQTQIVENRMNRMNRRPDDERGHIIASQLGGVAETWNLFPQSPNMNRNIGNRPILQSWYELENRIANFLRGHYNRRVDYRLDFSYNNVREPARPSHVRILADFYENNRIVSQYDATNRNGNAILGIPHFAVIDRSELRRRSSYSVSADESSSLMAALVMMGINLFNM